MLVSFEKITHDICSIIIRRPHKRNALNFEAIKALLDAITSFESHESFKVAILAGSEGNFCAGYDFNEVIDKTTNRPNMEHIKRMLWPLGARLSDKKLVIAAIEGHAAGFGFELALKCDFRIADRDARMGFMNRRFGVPIMNGGTVILPTLIGHSRASELIATGKAQLTQEALDFGVLTYKADVGCAQGRALNLARCLAKFDQAALLNDLQFTKRPLSVDLQHLMMNERERALNYLETCEPLQQIRLFLDGKIGRHGHRDIFDPHISV